MQLSAATFENREEKDRFERAILAGGCFWCMEAVFFQLDGVEKIVVGYTGGVTENPDIDVVNGGKSGHVLAIELYFNPEEVSYEQVLRTYFRNIDPFDNEGQFNDRGRHYRPIIYYLNDRQKSAAKLTKREIEELMGRRSLVEIVAAKKFWVGEEYQQDFHTKHPIKYNFYHYHSGRADRLKQLWSRYEEKVDYN